MADRSAAPPSPNLPQFILVRADEGQTARPKSPSLLSPPESRPEGERDKTKDETRARDKFRPINLSQVQRERKEGGQERDAAAQRDQHLSHSESVVVIAMMREKRRSEEAQVGMRWREIIGVEVI